MKDKCKKSKTKMVVRIILLVLLAAIIGEFCRSNYVIDVDRFTYQNDTIPNGFDGAVIVQLSDYHNHGGRYEDRLMDKVREQNPDFIFLTGDIADAGLTDIDAANSFLKKVSKIAPCYLVWGNHDQAISVDDRNKMIECCNENGIKLLEDEVVELERNGDKIQLAGTSDYLFSDNVEEMWRSYPIENEFTIWLHHYPEDFNEIVDTSRLKGKQADLVFSGHAHGGLIRFPFPNGLYAPGQGLFPKVTAGEYEYNGSKMIVSRGLGNSGYSRRFADPFEIVTVTLKSL